jgi:tetratricopeptide (TPR) repeat protein
MTDHDHILDFDAFKHEHDHEEGNHAHHHHGKGKMLTIPDEEDDLQLSEEEVNEFVDNIRDDMENQMDKILQLAAEGKLQKAERRIRKLVNYTRPLAEKGSDQETYQLAVDSDFELVLFSQLIDEKRKNLPIEPVPFPLDSMYHLWGMILHDLGKEEDSFKKFKIALEWNPLNTMIYGDMIEHCIRKDDMDLALELIKEEYSVAVERGPLCDVFYHLSEYLIEEHQFAKAAVVLDFIADKPAFHTEIVARYGEKPRILQEVFKDIERADLRETLAEFGFVPGPAPKVTAFFLDAAKRAHDMGEKDIERDMYRQLYDLTDDEEYKKKSESVE